VPNIVRVQTATQDPNTLDMEYPPYPPPSDDSNYNFLADIDMDAVTARLKHLAREAHASRIPYTDDGSEHHKLLSRAISNVLSTELARFTLAQIIDGLPTADTAWDSRSPAVFGDHPIEEHPELCPGVMNRARDFIQQFDQSVLRFDAQVQLNFHPLCCQELLTAQGAPFLSTGICWLEGLQRATD
jgi:hypothetical protein